MDKKTIGIIIAVIVVIVALYLAFGNKPATGPVAQPAAAPGTPGAVPEPVKTDQGTVTPQGVVAATGTSPIATSGEVLAPSGKPVKLDVTPGTPEAPQQSNPVAKPADLPSKTVKITMSSGGISPSGFTVKAGEPVTIGVTSGDSQTHVFKFDDPSLDAVAVGVGPGETRAITFPAPKAGTYKFHCDVPGHSSRGEVGEMIVK
ncbi:MAG: cupredoxin domain-containing protein [Candidatus Liptonbacteria bacterium]|nr:cupredoxin domain-containing protein [Candidatus Liptonbacteria bacterium]